MGRHLFGFTSKIFVAYIAAIHNVHWKSHILFFSLSDVLVMTLYFHLILSN